MEKFTNNPPREKKKLFIHPHTSTYTHTNTHKKTHTQSVVSAAVLPPASVEGLPSPLKNAGRVASRHHPNFV